MAGAESVFGGGAIAAIAAAVGGVIGRMIDRRRSPVDTANDVVEMVERQLEWIEHRVNRLEAENETLRAEVAGARDAERDCRRRMAILAGILADAGLPIPDDVVQP